MTLVSYAQNLEDVMLWRALRHVKNGFYIDIGAAWETKDSVTKLFYEAGWRGINVEPVEAMFRVLCEQRPRDCNLNMLVLDQKDDRVPFHVFDDAGISTISDEQKEFFSGRGYQPHEVFVKSDSLKNIVAENVPEGQDVHFLKIDAESSELRIIEGGDWEKFRPWIVVCETVDYRSSEHNDKNARKALEDRGYLRVYHDGVNDFFLAVEHQELLQHFSNPPNVFDEYITYAQKQAECAQKQAESVQKQAESAQRQAESEQSKAESISADLRAELAEANGNISQLRYEFNGVSAERDQLRTTVHALMTSTSWRITAPLRGLGLAKLKSRNVVKRVVPLAYQVLRRHPTLFNAAKRLLRGVPSVEFRLRRFLHNWNLAARGLATSGHSSRQSMDFWAAINAGSAGVTANASRDVAKVTLFYCEFSSTQTHPTGVVRVASKLLENLCNLGEFVIPVKLDRDSLQIAPLSKSEVEILSALADIRLRPLAQEIIEQGHFSDPSLFAGENNWLIIPEVTYHTFHSTPVTSRLIKIARDLNLKVGTVFYDNIPFHESAASHNREKHARYLSDISLSDVVWPISEFVSKELLAFYASEEKLNTHQVPYFSNNPLPEADSTERVLYDWEDSQKFIVAVGSICERKNQLSVVKAFNAFCSAFPDETWHLHLVGGEPEPKYSKAVHHEARKSERVHIHTQMSDAQIEKLYEKAAFTIFASTCEGYGLPITESLWRLRPVICADYGAMGSLAENGGCVTIDVTDIPAMQKAIEILAHDRAFYQSKIDEIIARPMQTWSEYAQKIISDTNNLASLSLVDCDICVWVDATIEAPGNSGIQRVTRQVCRALLELGCSLVPVKWDSEKNKVAIASNEELAHLAKWSGPVPDLWKRHLPLENSDRPLVYLLTDLPLNRSLSIQDRVISFFKGRGAHCVSIYYDAIPILMRDVYPQPFVEAMEQFTAMLDRMDRIVAISDASRKDLYRIMNRLDLAEPALERRVLAVSLAEEFPSVDRLRPLDFHNGEPFTFLCASTIEPRKNHLKLLEAFLMAERESARKLKLILVGRDSSFDAALGGKVRELVAQSENIEWLEDADDKALVACYERSHATVYPSFLEGFGLPIVESLWFHRPCICANFGQMGELSLSGGCLTANVRDATAIKNALCSLANSETEYSRLVGEASARSFKSWRHYASEIAQQMRALIGPKNLKALSAPTHEKRPRYLPTRPKLSVCITTYNRKKWLDLNIKNFLDVSSGLESDVELVVCDNKSAGDISDIFAKYSSHRNISVYQNSANIGMLNNLAQTVSFANGEYIWLVGDDDIIHENALRRILGVIYRESPALINLNYNVSTAEVPETRDGIKKYLAQASNYSISANDISGKIKDVSAENENFYTAIYSFVAERRFLWRMFHQDTSGQMFSSLQTCVPSSKYILSNMMEEKGCWLHEPAITVNLNVSWGEHANIWLLERIPEVYDLAQLNGVPRKSVAHWREHTFRNSLGSLDNVIKTGGEAALGGFDFARYVRRLQGVPVSGYLPTTRKAFAEAKQRGLPFVSDLSADELETLLSLHKDEIRVL
ncbi:glycosyltransferase [Rhizobium mayense]|uniref:Glycosyltransferase n=1 Tax=Rhizobium mayense TaxID=1312184 RepID=A0ABT7K5N2_9HYPH|nr:glycosyltransferase [Rhizobium mayense]MDL2403912.1 glycosyltransferase [Rhizobium mayense]